MGSEKILKFRDYWRAPRNSLDHAFIIDRYINLRRFQSLFRIFTVSPNSNKVAEALRNRYKFSRIWKKSIKETDVDTRRETEVLSSASND
jgi:hypothetical protein